MSRKNSSGSGKSWEILCGELLSSAQLAEANRKLHELFEPALDRSSKQPSTSKSSSRKWTLRAATLEDIDDIRLLISDPLQSAVGIEEVQLIQDQTYFIVESNTAIIACGGWSMRDADPATDAAKIRAFFVHPDWSQIRRRVGADILERCEDAIAQAGFHSAELIATAAGEPLYASRGFLPIERYEITLSDGLNYPVVKMRKVLS